jgi:hypothetical protein
MPLHSMNSVHVVIAVIKQVIYVDSNFKHLVEDAAFFAAQFLHGSKVILS